MTDNPIANAKLLLMMHEGLRLKPYLCVRGRTTIGYGRNLTDNGISEAEAAHLLANDIITTYRALHKQFPWFMHLDNVRQLALVDMAYQMGVDGLRGFKRMLRALQDKRWTVAAMEALDSKYHEQTPNRATRIANMLQSGKMPPELNKNSAEE